MLDHRTRSGAPRREPDLRGSHQPVQAVSNNPPEPAGTGASDVDRATHRLCARTHRTPPQIEMPDCLTFSQPGEIQIANFGVDFRGEFCFDIPASPQIDL